MNESLHAKVWEKCPKTGFVGLQRVVAATCYATAEFNQGFESAVARSYAAMGMKVGSHTMASAGKADAKRLRQSIRQVEESTQAARRARKAARARALDESYQAGGFLGCALGELGSVNCSGPIPLNCRFMCYATYAFCLLQIWFL